MKPPMDTDGHKSEIDQITKKIIGCAFTVGNRLGCGFLEKIYENAFVIELRKQGVRVAQHSLWKFGMTTQWWGHTSQMWLWKVWCLSRLRQLSSLTKYIEHSA